jgi:hypothetical protein
MAEGRARYPQLDCFGIVNEIRATWGYLNGRILQV